MAHAATAEHAEHGIVEPMDSAISDAVADVAAAAAAAALVALPQVAAAAVADAGQCQPCSVSCPRLSIVDESSFNSSKSALLLCVDAPSGDSPEDRQIHIGNSQHPRCFRCGQPAEGKHTRGKWPTVKHHPRCPPASVKQEPATPAVAAAPPRSRKRRADSDPGEPCPRTPSPRRTRPTTTRVTPPMPIAAQKKQRTTRQDVRIMRLLDETHARRMAASAASATGGPAHS